MSNLGPVAGNKGDVDALDARVVVPWWARMAQILKDPGAATYTVSGTAAPTTFGSSTASSDSSDGPYLAHISAASAGATAGMQTAFTIVRRDWTPTLVARIKTGPSTANKRDWCGFFSADPSASAALGAIHGAAIGYDTGTDGTIFWRTVTSDGAAETRTASSVAYAANTAFAVRIEMDASEVRFWIDDNHVATHTTNLPGATTLMGLQVSATATTATARRILVGRLTLIYK